ncbi:LacI family DNA-binding transcriptional regulator [Natronincola ferrireducens]|uniref:Transcriptional regulator, LacI family n=1 Tax=Natronincola ferrireducens TaxID=393762 RepID=A0A1G8YSM6_9FIRM|nr:LacI family DNA-binding transcriptional regulator [Natronincola ferrireducens]SDK05444.1 transcriptional regulator, LacI family [Natronincola ferrireducens]
MKKKPTISDIAKLANVSIATVSRVLSNSDYPVKEEVRQKILGISKEVNYKPNIFGKMLKGGSSKEIGVIIPSVTNPFYAQLVSAVEKQCINRGYIPLICSSYNNPKMEKRHIDILFQKQVAGIVMSTIRKDDPFLNIEAHDKNVKVVLFDQTRTDLQYDSVSFDFRKGGYMAVDYLIQCGHKDIAFLTAPIDRKSRKMILEGYKQALKINGIMYNSKRVIISSMIGTNDSGEFEYENGKTLARLLLQDKVLPDAIVTINDMTAIGIIRELTSEGIEVPKDVSIIGFDNISISSMITPSLTTINQPSYETGTLATKMLLDRIEGKEIETNNIVMKPTLIKRDSVKKIEKETRQ